MIKVPLGIQACAYMPENHKEAMIISTLYLIMLIVILLVLRNELSLNLWYGCLMSGPSVSTVP